ncbi:MAG: glycosyltransferase family 4 protein [Candidatus Magasanikbacteria bacterium]|nr:glycosyltransferase family 4 protein [Candidatus Magasanikbacteria bacterium]
MKIAHVVSTFSPQLGGMGAVCADEASSLVRQGHEVVVFTLLYDSAVDYTEHDKKFPFKIVRIKPFIKIGDAGFVPQLLWKIGGNFDLVHLHYPFYGGAEWLWFLKTPLVITYHMDAQVGGFKLLIQKMYNLIWPDLLFAKAKKIITVDKNPASSVTDFYKTKRVEIANGVDIHIFKLLTPDFDTLGLADLKDKKIILFVGNLLPLKRLDVLISALQLLSDKNAVLLVVGEGVMLGQSQHLVKQLGLDSQVRFVGPCHDLSKLAKFYNLAWCVVVPSDYESFSLVAIEAMACGKPLILAHLPDSKNRFSQAIFFDKGSAESLKNALLKTLSLSPEEIRKITESGRLKVMKDFSLETHMNTLNNVYQEITSH